MLPFCVLPGVGTLPFDLLTPAEEEIDLYTREHRFKKEQAGPC